MNKMLSFIFIASAIVVGSLGIASAYYTYPTYGSNYYYTNTESAVASYTVGCTTYYYNPYTNQQLYTQYVCTTVTQPSTYYYGTWPYTDYTSYSYMYTYPTYTYQYDYPYYYPYAGYTDTSYNYGCYYQNGYQICY